MLSEPRNVWHLTVQEATAAAGAGHCPTLMRLLELLKAAGAPAAASHCSTPCQSLNKTEQNNKKNWSLSHFMQLPTSASHWKHLSRPAGKGIWESGKDFSHLQPSNTQDVRNGT